MIFKEKFSEKKSFVITVSDLSQLKGVFSAQEIKYIGKELDDKKTIISVPKLEQLRLVVFIEGSSDLEQNRKTGNKLYAILSRKKAGGIQFHNLAKSKQNALAVLEGLLLSNYQFNRYKTDKKENVLTIDLIKGDFKAKSISELEGIVSGVNLTRDLVNDPVNKLHTEAFIDIAQSLAGKDLKVQVLRASQIESLGMGGLLGVNMGSLEEPAFIQLEYSPKKAQNKKPIVLVGKGILFDTGGINIKTGDFMTNMKADMGGAGTVLGILKAVSENALPVHLVGLLPVTENRISGNELVPGDVITMHNGKTVEVLNTDAEGRLVLADALAFASKYKPELVIDFATLTGSAARALGGFGAPVMGTADQEMQALQTSGEKVYERLVHFPLWEEFKESLNSSVADMNNLGSGPGQLICAGHFLSAFVEGPWIHLDIAGPAFLDKSNGYHPKGGTGFGVRLVYQYLKDKFAL